MDSGRPPAAQGIRRRHAGHRLPFGTEFEDGASSVADPRHLRIEVDRIAIMVFTLPKRGDHSAHLGPRDQKLAKRRLAGREGAHDNGGDDEESDTDPNQVDVGRCQQAQSDRRRTEQQDKSAGNGQGLQAITTADRANEHIERNRCDPVGRHFIEQEQPPGPERGAQDRRHDDGPGKMPPHLAWGGHAPLARHPQETPDDDNDGQGGRNAEAQPDRHIAIGHHRQAKDVDEHQGVHQGNLPRQRLILLVQRHLRFFGNPSEPSKYHICAPSSPSLYIGATC